MSVPHLTVLGRESRYRSDSHDLSPYEQNLQACTFNGIAPQPARVVRTNSEHGFIKAKVIAYNDCVKFSGEAGAKDAGRWRIEGKDNIVRGGDVMRSRINV